MDSRTIRYVVLSNFMDRQSAGIEFSYNPRIAAHLVGRRLSKLGSGENRLV